MATLSRSGPGNSSAASFGRRGRNHSSSSSMDRVRNSAESLLSRASRDTLRSSSSGGRNAPGANATFDIVDVPTGDGNSALFLRSGGPPVGGTGGILPATKHSAAAAASSSLSPAAAAAAAPPGGKSVDASSGAAAKSADPAAPRVVTANVRYRNEAGRAAVLGVAQSINHDFGALTSIVNVTLGSIADLDGLSANPDIEWVDKNGAVFFVQPFGKS